MANLQKGVHFTFGGGSMGRRRIEVFVYRDIVFRMRQGESMRQMSEALGIGRNTLKEIRRIAQAEGWLAPEVSPGI